MNFRFLGFFFLVDALNLAGLFPCFLENLNFFWWISSCFLPSGVCVCRLGAFEPCAWPGLSCRLAQALQRDTIYHADGGKPTCFQDGFWIMLPTYFPGSQLLDLFWGCYKWFKQHILGYNRDVIGISWGYITICHIWIGLFGCVWNWGINPPNLLFEWAIRKMMLHQWMEWGNFPTIPIDNKTYLNTW